MPVTRATSVNARVLVWARQRAGLGIEEAAARVQKTPDVLAAWERGDKYPTYNQLEQLAESVYKRPVALFFLPEPPAEEPIQREFRILPDAEVDRLSADTRFALRDALAFQLSLNELTAGANPAERLITRDIRVAQGADPERLAGHVREYLGISLDAQRRWPTPRVAMEQWRERVERVGIFAFKRAFDQREVSGFCVAAPVFPIIVINNSTAFTRQIFTLVHELGHLLFGVSSITSADEAFTDRLEASARDVEIACNRFAAAVLVPDASFPWTRFSPRTPDHTIEEVANDYSVSREVILRKLLDRGLVSQATYAARVRLWAQQADVRTEGGGGNYYATQAAYIGRGFLNLAFAQYHAGNINLAELAGHLRMRARNVGRLEDFIMGRE